MLRKDEEVGGVDEGDDKWDFGVAMEVFGVGEDGECGWMKFLGGFWRGMCVSLPISSATSASSPKKTILQPWNPTGSEELPAVGMGVLCFHLTSARISFLRNGEKRRERGG